MLRVYDVYQIGNSGSNEKQEESSDEERTAKPERKWIFFIGIRFIYAPNVCPEAQISPLFFG